MMVGGSTGSIDSLLASSLNELSSIARDYKAQDAQPLPTTFWNQCQDTKKRAVESGDQLLAKAVWSLETIGRIQDHYVSAFRSCKTDHFYDGWCLLERCEIELGCLQRHLDLMTSNFGLGQVLEHVPRWQALFPYRVFLSPGMIVERANCSTCDTPIRLRGGCDHEIGEIYDGEMCVRTITQVKMLEVSVVTNPVQRYSVAFPEGSQYNYALVHYVASGLRSPWDRWNYKKYQVPTALPFYTVASPASPCPCKSGKQFDICCANKRKLREHVQVVFETPPPPELPDFVGEATYHVANDGPQIRSSSRDQGASASASASLV